MREKLTITVDEKIYAGLHRIIGRGKISRFIESLVSPHVLRKDLESGYREMAADEAREADETFNCGYGTGREGHTYSSIIYLECEDGLTDE